MLDELFELFERDRKSTTNGRGGLRGRLMSLIDGDRDHRQPYPASVGSNQRRRDWDHDDDHSTPDSDDDDRYGTTGSRGRRHQRDNDMFDFGD